jgi:hypothetical protein
MFLIKEKCIMEFYYINKMYGIAYLFEPYASWKLQ